MPFMPFTPLGELELRRPERRRERRYPFQASIEIEWGSARLMARTRDISETGLFIEAEDVLWVGAAFRARLVTEHSISLECVVKRIEPGFGMGVSVTLPEDQRAHYQEILAKLAQNG